KPDFTKKLLPVGHNGYDIDLRSFLNKWGHAFAVDLPESMKKFKNALHFFAIDDQVIHKVYPEKAVSLINIMKS
ncbi:MAG: hypothetical protein MK132_18465, partial [Lentisphaerales bacterium]|nr:hypothetical protein [Lentisphaerales bacterium]